VAEEPVAAPVVAVQENVQEEIQLLRCLAVYIRYAGDMAGLFTLLGLFGAAGLFPSLQANISSPITRERTRL